MIQSQCMHLCSGALKCTSVAARQVDCGEMPLDLRHNFNWVKSTIKYKYVKGNPASNCFQESVQFGAENYANTFRPVFAKVREVLKALPLAHMEVDEVVIPGCECV